MSQQPTTPASDGAQRLLDVDVIARAERARARDRCALLVVRRMARWLVVLALAAVPVACLALPNGMRFPCRSKQSEAKGNLKALYVALESYRAEFGHYTDDPTAMGWQPRAVRLRYEYFVDVNEGRDEPNAATPAFRAYAVGVSEEQKGDLWRITHDNDIANMVNACR